MKVAFYAPLKSPNHPTPSGDRAMARALMSALKADQHAVTLASELRIYDGSGLPQTQTELTAAAEREIKSVLQKGKKQGWQVWLTYHNYYKAPDLIGPHICAELGIPYVIIEASRAKKRLNGAWAPFAKRAEAACDAAHAILYLTQQDAHALTRDAPSGQALIHLSPFLDQDTLPPKSDGSGPMLSVGMMRHGDKLASYRLIADALEAMPRVDWKLNIAGDGPAFDNVRKMMTPFGDRVNLLGALDYDALAAQYAQASLFFWPGVNEAFGMVYLEAQAAGVPVVTQERPGVCDVVVGDHPRPHQGVAPLVKNITNLLDSPKLRSEQAERSRQFVAANHLRGAASENLSRVLVQVTGNTI